MNNLSIKKKQGLLFSSLNNNYNTTNVINVELINAAKKTEKSKVKGKTITSSKKAHIILQVEKQMNVIDNRCGDLSINSIIKKQSYVDARKNARKKLK